MTSSIARGDVVVLADRMGEFSGKPRPAVILQGPLFGKTVPLPVCLITSVASEAPLLRIAVPAGPASGLEVPSWVAIDMVTTVRQRRIGQRIGRLDGAKMIEISRALLVFLGIAEAAGVRQRRRR